MPYVTKAARTTTTKCLCFPRLLKNGKTAEIRAVLEVGAPSQGAYLPYVTKTARTTTTKCDVYTSFYSVRRATTGSFFAAALAGIKPLIKVSTMLMTTIIAADAMGRDARVAIPVKLLRIALIAMERA